MSDMFPILAASHEVSRCPLDLLFTLSAKANIFNQLEAGPDTDLTHVLSESMLYDILKIAYPLKIAKPVEV